jgi:hypothetical protein
VNSPSGDDAQRTLEQRAVGNVAALARRLGYADALDRYAEKSMIVAIAVVVFLVVGAVAVSMLVSRPDPRAAEVLRCELDAAVDVVHALRADLRSAKPELSQADLERLVTVRHANVKAEAARRCARGT